MSRKFLDSIFAIIAGAIERVSFTQIPVKVPRPEPAPVAGLFCLALLLAARVAFAPSGQTEIDTGNGFKPYI